MRICKLALLAAAGACATPPPSFPSLPENPEECIPIVEAHYADLTTSVDQPLELRGMVIPPAPPRGASGEIQVLMIVDERGVVRPETIRVLGATSAEFAAQLSETTARFRFRPAKSGTCWVPSLYTYTIRP
jgi:hypothetical protein